MSERAATARCGASSRRLCVQHVAVVRVLAGYGAVGETAFSRSEETEADEIGLLIAADAGYDPRAAVGFWRKMSSQGGEKPPEFLSTHPNDDKRAARLEALMPKALAIYEEAKRAGR